MPRRPRLIRYQPAPTLITHLMGEFVGTFFFVLTISLTLQQPEAVGGLAPIAIGFVFCSMVFSFGYISSAVFNPAVAIGLWVLELMDTVKTLLYIVTEVTAATSAGFIAWFLVGDGDGCKAPAPKTDKAVDIFRSGIAEFIYTFGLMSAVLHVACSRQRDNQHYGLGLGVFIAAGVFAIGGISGGAINPSVALGLQLPMCAAVDCRPARYFWLYWVFCIGGAVTASFVFALMHPVDVDDSDDEEEGDEVCCDEEMSEVDMLAATDSSFVVVKDPSGVGAPLPPPMGVDVNGNLVLLGSGMACHGGGGRRARMSNVPSLQNLDDSLIIRGGGGGRSRSPVASNNHFVFPSPPSNANLGGAADYDHFRSASGGSGGGPRPASGGSGGHANEPFFYASSSSKDGGLRPFAPEGTMIFAGGAPVNNSHSRSRSYTPGLRAASGGRSRRPSMALSQQGGSTPQAGASLSMPGHSRSLSQQPHHHHSRSRSGGIRAPNANQKTHASSSSSAPRRRSVIHNHCHQNPPSRSASEADDLFSEQQYLLFLQQQRFLQQQQQMAAAAAAAAAASRAGGGGSLPSVGTNASANPPSGNASDQPSNRETPLATPKAQQQHGRQQMPMLAATVPADADTELPFPQLGSSADGRAAPAPAAPASAREGGPPSTTDTSAAGSPFGFAGGASFGVSHNPPHYLASTLRDANGGGGVSALLGDSPLPPSSAVDAPLTRGGGGEQSSGTPSAEDLLRQSLDT